MACESCRYLENTQPGSPLSRHAFYPCRAPYQGLPPDLTIPLPASNLDEKGRTRPRRTMYLGAGVGCLAYQQRG